ncbi:branched-chain-amino-acid transaminase [Isobaculum melis]|uniref:Branched-chain-amino-acid aminotransferase n=1 Tax=Isobaculum melis TaxID=142588 RepID=A0A1H9T8T7_9LACT|nr:branched-chain-amino-acid transaminase [Isobaculum melis]SER93680.1 branched-chain amino acid aminotransferase [Isobaculum melis]
MSQLIYVNGAFVEKEQAKVSVYDHGFLYGDGVFEGIRAYDGNVFKLKEHIDRLFESADSLLLEMPFSKEALSALVIETLVKNHMLSAYIRVIISRGVGSLSVSPFGIPEPGVVIICEPLQYYSEEDYEKGAKIVTAGTRRNNPDALSPQVKSLNYLNNILAIMEAKQAGATEALMLNSQGFVVECSADNIFIVKDGVIKTPTVNSGALNGITRRSIIEVAKELGYPVIEEILTRHEVYTADEVFITGTAAEVLSVVDADGRKIGNGQPGEVMQALLPAFRKYARAIGTKYTL